MSTVGPLSDVTVGPAAAADDDAPRCSNRSPPQDARVAAKFEDAAFNFTKWDIYNDGTSEGSFQILQRYFARVSAPLCRCRFGNAEPRLQYVSGVQGFEVCMGEAHRLPVQMQVPLLQHRDGPKRRRQKWQTGLQQHAAGTESDDVEQRYLELEPGEGKGEASRRLLGSSRTKFDALPLGWSPPRQRGN